MNVFTIGGALPISLVSPGRVAPKRAPPTVDFLSCLERTTQTACLKLPPGTRVGGCKCSLQRPLVKGNASCRTLHRQHKFHHILHGVHLPPSTRPERRVYRKGCGRRVTPTSRAVEQALIRAATVTAHSNTTTTTRSSAYGWSARSDRPTRRAGDRQQQCSQADEARCSRPIKAQIATTTTGLTID